MNIVGIDLGNANANTSKGIVFESKLKPGTTDMNKDDIKVTYNKIKYTVGSVDGALNIRKNKHKKESYKIELLTAIALSLKVKNITTNIVVGVPIVDFNDKELVNDIKETILSWGTQKITVNGVEKIININAVEVFAESGIVFGDRERFKNEKTLVIDFGGSTVDVSSWDGLRQESAKTYKDGMISLYSNVALCINDVYKSDVKDYNVKDIIGKTEAIINQEIKDINFVDSVVQLYVDNLTSYIKQNFPIDTVNSIQLIGGGAIQLAKYLKEEYENSELHENAAFANAMTYEKVGEIIWQ